ncbi:MAG: ArnT family glycosyltransferase [Terriglobia bacterium]
MEPASPPPRPASEAALYDRLLAQPRFHLAFIVLFAAIVIFSQLAGNGLPNYDDCYYAQKAKEILQTGDWWTLHLDHQPRFDNPPLFMWLLALSYQLFGVGDSAARFPSALLGVATIVLVYFFARRLFGPWAGFFSAFVLSTSLLFLRYARRAMVDVTLSFFVCAALFALVLALEKSRRYFLLWGLCIGLGILTKSVLGLSPLAITVLYLLLTRRGKLFLNGYFLLGSSMILLLGGSWYFHQSLTHGQDFLDVHFRWLIFERAFQLEPQPWTAHLSYVKELATSYWPWLPLFLLGTVRLLRQGEKKVPHASLLVLWPLLILVTMSLLQTRVIWYVLPIFPAMAMISGHALHTLLPERRRLLFVKGAVAVALAALIAFNATPLELSPPRETDVRALAPSVKHWADNGARVVAFRLVYHQFNNALLFYSDHAADPIFQSYPELAKALDAPALVLCVLAVSELEGVEQNVPGVYLIRKADKLALIANRPVDVNEVGTR